MKQAFIRIPWFLRWRGVARVAVLACAAAFHLVAAPVMAEADRAPPSEALALPAPTGEVVLRITGQIRVKNTGEGAHFDEAMLSEFAEQQLTTHTSVTDGPQRFRGILLRDVLDRVGAHGAVIEASALNDYIIDIPFSDVTAFDVILATHMNGAALTPRDKGPLWIVYPRDDWAELQDVRYDYRWVWQLTDLKIK